MSYLSKSVIAFCSLMASQAYALTVDTPLADTAKEAQARALFLEIRCVVCQSESLADSPAEVARDMRQTIREQVAAGVDNEAIKSMLVARYGDFILMRPPVKPSTWPLWFGPGTILAMALLFIYRYFRKTARS